MDSQRRWIAYDTFKLIVGLLLLLLLLVLTSNETCCNPCNQREPGKRGGGGSRFTNAARPDQTGGSANCNSCGTGFAYADACFAKRDTAARPDTQPHPGAPDTHNCRCGAARAD